ncbi:MAG: sulfatase-like hydrolase/transferase [Geminicoccaceae bacterium]
MSKAPNLLFLFSDQHAAKVAGCYGDPLVQTPNLDRLAARGVTFDNAYCPAPICVPSRMALHTGRWPKNQHVWINSDMLPSDLPTMAHSLAISGRRPTLVGRMHSLGPDQLRGYSERLVGDHSSNWPGIGSNHDMGPLGHAHLPNRDSLSNAGCGQSSYEAHDVDVVEAACAHLDALGERRRSGDATPFAATVGFMLPHNPYVARPEDYRLYEGRVGLPGIPAAPAGEEHPYIAAWRDHSGCRDVDEASILRARTAYYGLVTRLDTMIGQVLDALERNGLAEDTLIVYASDHGDLIGEHGLWWKMSFYEDSVRVPVILSGRAACPRGAARAGRQPDRPDGDHAGRDGCPAPAPCRWPQLSRVARDAATPGSTRPSASTARTASPPASARTRSSSAWSAAVAGSSSTTTGCRRSSSTSRPTRRNAATWRASPPSPPCATR